jgi:DNA-binding XRE family transcriptional regulator
MVGEPKVMGFEEAAASWVADGSRTVVPAILRYQDRAGKLSFEKIAEGFAMTKSQMAETLGLKPDTVYRAERLRARSAQTRMREMLEIVTRVTVWAGGPVQAFSWYRAEPIPAFGGRTAEALVKDGKAAAVRDYLDHVAVGGFA